jgi:hypothetical protein
MNLKAQWSRIAMALLIGAALTAAASVFQPQFKAGSIFDLACELLLLPGKLFASFFQDRGDASPEFLWRSRIATGVVLAGVAWCCLTLSHPRTSAQQHRVNE